MTRCIINFLREWGLQKIFTVTVDNASSNDVTVEKLSDKLDDWGTNSMNGQHLQMRCMSHIVNLIVKDGLKESGISIACVRYAVKYIRQSPARLRKFQECCESINIVKKSLCLDVPTRCNSTYLMLSRAIEYERAIKEYFDRDTDLSGYLMFDAISDRQPVGMLTRTDWDDVKRISQFLEIFYNLTLKVSRSLYVTSNAHFLEIGQVAVYLNRLITTEDELLSEMTSSMWKFFEKYWGEPTKMNKVIFIACVLDPHYKFTTVSFVLKKIFGDEGTIIEKEVHTYMSSLFNKYVSKSVSKDTGGKVSTSLPSSSFSTMETSTPGLGELLDEIRKHKAASGGVDSKTKLEKYLAEDPENERPDFDILAWWKVNSPRFPILAKMARDVLAIPILSVAYESSFSTGGHILDQFRSSLTPKLVETLVCLQDWLQSESLPVNVEEDLNFLEILEEDGLNGSSSAASMANFALV
ncbi:zinc finger BED domain-containing protein RICESLEEPER 1-like [Nicotiana sylvestris]|uniref:Zinc finger BED domain-containing protein RICESLEEPER 1-like n=1 Tax=Nicotiana sylvestris TaxID=4096 RepID=A0A1U7VLQ3_NICSY|nr:PREDICTED: zinc finger BED domain-containing protein RICESLEEPER 1-like [Nicotiana sylvestris]